REGLSVRYGPIVSIGHVAKELRHTDAIAVDMESAWLARAADGRPFGVVRAVVDTPARALSNPVATAVGGLRALRSLARATPGLVSWASAAGPRRVLLAGPRSFCAGVERAIEIVERAWGGLGRPASCGRRCAKTFLGFTD